MKKDDEITLSRLEDASFLKNVDPKRLHPSLMLIYGKDTLGRIYRVKDKLIIGRGPLCDIKIEDNSISREHAKISIDDSGGINIIDLGSKNGTFINGRRVEKAMLSGGDKIKIGNSILKFTYLDDIDKDFQDKLYASVIEDSLTGAYNRRYFEECLARDLSSAKRHGTLLSIFIFDIDNFKTVNDTYGHPAGDLVLEEISKLVKNTIRKEDLFARIGGEEFALLIKESRKDKAIGFAERIRKLIQGSVFNYKQFKLNVTISIGLAMFDKDVHKTYKDFIDAADKFLLLAKGRGKNNTFGE